MSLNQNISNPIFDTYQEFLERSTWRPAEKFHNWNTGSTLSTFQKVSRLIPGQTKIVEIGVGSGCGEGSFKTCVHFTELQ